MQLRRFDNTKDFWYDAQDYLLQHEAEHNLLLGISHTLLHYPDRYPDPPYSRARRNKRQYSGCRNPHSSIQTGAVLSSVGTIVEATTGAIAFPTAFHPVCCYLTCFPPQ